MGLLQYINLHYYSKKSLNVGLLRLAQKYLSDKSTASFCLDSFLFDKPFFQFHNFSSELELEKTALFVPHNNEYSILFSHALDNVSIQKSRSTYDFWKGMLPDTSWIFFTGSALVSFYQFFSESDRETVQSIQARWLCIGSKPCIFLVCSSRQTKLDYKSLDDVLPSLSNLLDNTVKNYLPDNSVQNDSFTEIQTSIQAGLSEYLHAHCFELQTSCIMDSSVLAKNEKKYILFELFCRMKLASVKPNISFLSNSHSIKLVLFSHDAIDPDMYEMYLHQNLDGYFLEETLSQLRISDKGIFSLPQDIVNFLL